MYIVTFTAHQQRNMVRTPPPHFFGAGDATVGDYNYIVRPTCRYYSARYTYSSSNVNPVKFAYGKLRSM